MEPPGPYHGHTAQNMVDRVDSRSWSYHGPQKVEAMTVDGRQTMHNSAERSQENEMDSKMELEHILKVLTMHNSAERSQENEMDSEMELEYIIKVKEMLETRERELRRLYEAKKRKKIARVSPLVSTNKTQETTRSYSTRKLSASKEFTKRDGTASNQGLMYEFKLAALIFFRLVKNATPFHMCANLEGADLFDDIVFKFEPKDAFPSPTTTTTTVFMQLKHKQKSSESEAKPINFSLFRSNNGGITLMRFFKSFSQIEEKISAERSDIIFNSDLDSCEFVIYTNTKIRHDLFVNKVGTLSEVENLLKTGGYIFLFREKLIHEIEAYKMFIDRVTELTKSNNPTTIFELISFEAEKLRGVIRNKELFNRVDRIKTTSDISDLKVIYDIIKEVKDLDISKFKRFVKKLKVFTCQCNEDEASKVIRQDLQKVLFVPDPYYELMFVRLMNSFKNWWQNDNRYLTENTEMWQDVVRDSDMIIFEIRLNKLREMGLVFKEEMLKECQEQLRDECGIVSIVSYSVWPTLTCLKVCQALGSTEENGVLLIQFKDLKKMGNRIWQRWRDGYRRTVVLDNVTTKRIELPNLQDLKLTVGSIVMEHPELRFLIIWKSSDPLRYELQTEEDRYTEIQDYSSFDDLHRSSQEKLERATVTATAVGSLEPPEVHSMDEKNSPSASEIFGETYRKGFGLANSQRRNFEVKMCSLVYLRLKKKYNNFNLGFNIKVVKGFSNIMFRYHVHNDQRYKLESAMKTTATTKIMFILLKHSSSQQNNDTIRKFRLFNTNENFLNYYKTFCEIQNTLRFKRSAEKNSFFVLFTNSDVTSDLLQWDEGSEENFGMFQTSDQVLKLSNRVVSDLVVFKRFVDELQQILAENNPQEFDMKIYFKVEKVQRALITEELLEIVEEIKVYPHSSKIKTLMREINKINFCHLKLFASRFKIFCQQQSGNELDNIVQNEIEHSVRSSNTNLASISSTFVDKIRAWCEGYGTFITDKSEILDEIVVQHFQRRVKELISLNLVFNEDVLNDMNQKLSTIEGVVNIVANGSSATPTSLKVYQALSQSNNPTFIFEKLKYCMSEDSPVLDLWTKQLCHTLVIERSRSITRESSQDFWDELCKRKQETSGRLIFISTKEHNLANLFGNKIKVSEIQDHTTFHHFNEDSKKRLMEREVNFQGFTVKLNEIITKNDATKLNSDSLAALMKNYVTLGKYLSTSVVDNYIPRDLRHFTNLKKEVLNENELDTIFVFSGDTKETIRKHLPPGEKLYELNENKLEIVDFHKFNVTKKSNTSIRAPIDSSQKRTPPLSAQIAIGNITRLGNDRDVESFPKSLPATETPRFMILGKDKEDEDFEFIAMKYKNIHWILVDDTVLTWKKTKGSIKIIKENIDHTIFRHITGNVITQIPGKFILIIAEPGMGKTSLLYSNALKIKEANKSKWVIQLNLNEITPILDEFIEKKNGLKETREFITKAMNINAIEIQYFETFLKEMENVVVLMDGFDDISPHYKEEVSRFIHVLLNSKMDFLCVTSRQSMKEYLEEEFCNLSFNIEPLTRDQQIGFLESCLQSQNTALDPEEIKHIAHSHITQMQLISKVSQNTKEEKNIDFKVGSNKEPTYLKTNGEEEFTGNPFQTKMLAEAFTVDSERYYKISPFNLPSELNLLQIFEKIISKKYELYFIHIKNEITSPFFKRILNTLKKEYFESYMSLAMLLLFNQNDYTNLRPVDFKERVESFLNTLDKYPERAGLIDKVTNGKPQFVYRLFAEYFAAQWFFNNLEHNFKFIKNEMFEHRYECVRKFFDLKLAEDSSLHTAVLLNNIDKVKEFIKESSNTDKAGRTALHLAAAYNHSQVAKVLINYDVKSSSVEDNLGWKPIQYAERAGSWDVIELLLNNCSETIELSKTHSLKASNSPQMLSLFKVSRVKHINQVVDIAGKFNTSNPLVEASKKGHIKIIEYLVGVVADVDNLVGELESPLYAASLYGKLEVVKYLVESGAQINSYSKNHLTPLYAASQNGHVEVVKYLVENKAEIEAFSDSGMLPIHIASSNNHLNVVEFLVEHGANVEATDCNQTNALMFASRHGNINVVKYLIKKGILVNTMNRCGFCALHFAALNSQCDVFCYLHRVGSYINSMSINLSTPLLFAASSGSLEIVKYLVANEVRLDHVDRDGNNALALASRGGKLEVVKYLLEMGECVHYQNRDGNSALLLAVREGKLNMIKFLLSEGADIKQENRQGLDAFMLAAQAGKIDVLDYLLSYIDDIDQKNRDNDTALLIASKTGQLYAVRFLIRKGADINHENRDGNTSLILASMAGQIDVVKYLYEKGAKLNHTNRDGCSAADLALLMRQDIVVGFMEECNGYGLRVANY